jgi:hypothetical protein
MDCNARYIAFVYVICVLKYIFVRRGQWVSPEGSMAQKKVKNPCLRLYNSCTNTFIKDGLFLTFNCQDVHKCFVAGNSEISVLKQ